MPKGRIRRLKCHLKMPRFINTFEKMICGSGKDIVPRFGGWKQIQIKNEVAGPGEGREEKQSLSKRQRKKLD